MNLVFLSFNFPPDLSAGSFRSKALSYAINADLEPKEKLFVITTQPNRYDSYKIQAPDEVDQDGIQIHRVSIPNHHNKWILQIFSFMIFALKSLLILKRIKPDFIICTTGRHMTSLLTYFL